jgi:type II secretory pathway predicted ATPase ExeA
MYASQFGLRRRPFRATPDNESYYPATTHERALTQLLGGLQEETGLLLLTGAPGTGKTLLCHRLLDQVDAETNGIFLTNSHFSGRCGLLQAILYDLSLPYQGLGEQELRLALTDHLLQEFAAGKRAVVVIDEAQHLNADLLEELRLLGNLETPQGKAVQVVLVSLPPIGETLRQPELASFNQRLSVRALLEPLDVHEAVDYVVHQLRLAGGRREDIISDEALELLARGTQGIPRVLNQATHQALQLAAAAETALVDAEAALEALNLLGLDGEPAAEEVSSDLVPDLEPTVCDHESLFRVTPPKKPA